MAAPEFRHGLKVQQTSVQKQTRLLCPFPFSLETINCLCHFTISCDFTRATTVVGGGGGGLGKNKLQTGPE